MKFDENGNYIPKISKEEARDKIARVQKQVRRENRVVNRKNRIKRQRDNVVGQYMELVLNTAIDCAKNNDMKGMDKVLNGFVHSLKSGAVEKTLEEMGLGKQNDNCHS